MRCPACKKELVSGEPRRYETLLEHGMDPNGDWGERPLRPIFICTTTGCEFNSQDKDKPIYWDPKGGLYGSYFRSRTKHCSHFIYWLLRYICFYNVYDNEYTDTSALDSYERNWNSIWRRHRNLEKSPLFRFIMQLRYKIKHRKETKEEKEKFWDGIRLGVQKYKEFYYGNNKSET
jgi:hypothetical protein